MEPPQNNIIHPKKNFKMIFCPKFNQNLKKWGKGPPTDKKQPRNKTGGK